eukprot:Anaeramoba_ignava/c20481_g1_i1.p1 GENE.c20481_g1_i1~~c20481_g1_i1.p1  ORF type:complete len:391 (-),score=90.94 c20481_g1_i1:407-1579(-)
MRIKLINPKEQEPRVIEVSKEDTIRNIFLNSKMKIKDLNKAQIQFKKHILPLTIPQRIGIKVGEKKQLEGNLEIPKEMKLKRFYTEFLYKANPPSRKVTAKNNEIQFSDNFSIQFQRTLRVPDSDKTYYLPPGLGNFPIMRVNDFKDKIPDHMAKTGGVFFPMHQREAMWINFRGWEHCAVKISAGKICAVSGKPYTPGLSQNPQNYCAIPRQPWLDGFNSGDGYVRQFVAMPLGKGYTVEKQLTGKEDVGGIQIEYIPGMKQDARITQIDKHFVDYNDYLNIDSTPEKLGLAKNQMIYMQSDSLNLQKESTVEDFDIEDGDEITLIDSDLFDLRVTCNINSQMLETSVKVWSEITFGQVKKAVAEKIKNNVHVEAEDLIVFVQKKRSWR